MSNRKEYLKQWRKKNSKRRILQTKKWRKENPERAKQHNVNNRKSQQEYKKRLKLDHYVIYYLPEEHYCGHTQHWPNRKYVHKYNGKNINGARILFTTKTKTEAVYYEALFCSVLGINGIKLR